MSELADKIRTGRQRFAAPKGIYDRVIALLRVLLPIGVGALAAVLVLAPFSMRSELSFVLDKNEVDIARERMRVESALYRGEDSQGRPFSLRAGSAVQKSSRDPIVRLTDLSARILLSDGPAQIVAQQGDYNMNSEQVRVDAPVRVETASGYRVATSNVAVDLKSRTMRSFGPVNGRANIGTFSADRLIADLNRRTIILDGNARLRIEQNALKRR
jgi:lipopolysaccharide export system protein LptC